MNKRFLAFVLCVLVVVLSICSCEEKSPADDSSSTTATTVTTEPIETTTTTTTSTEDDPLINNGIYIPRPEKEITRILMIGNSSCYYYVDELAGIAAADGKEIVVANLYKSGCTLEQHWEYYLSGAENCELFVTNSRGRGKPPVTTLAGSLEYAKERLGGDWDVIALHQRGYYTLVGDAESAKPETMPYAKEIYKVIRENHPEALLYWIQTWAYDVGYQGGTPAESVPDIEKQNFQYEETKKLAYIMAEEEGVNVIPQGDAWQIARESDIIGQTLCARLGVNNDLGDHSHDGDIGGGQYLNACVWYEVLMGESCVGNTWRPKNYNLSEEKIAILQNAAHEAVAAVYGPNYAQ